MFLALKFWLLRPLDQRIDLKSSSLSDFKENRVLVCKIQYVISYYFPLKSFSGGSVALLLENFEKGHRNEIRQVPLVVSLLKLHFIWLIFSTW